MTGRRHRPSTAPKYKWCGHAAVQTVLPQTSQTTATPMLLCPSIGVTGLQGEVIIERIILNFLTHRLLTDDLDGYGFLVSKQKTIPATGLPTEILNPLETTADNFEFGNKDLLLQGLLMVPECTIRSDTQALKINGRGEQQSYEFNGRRRLERLNQALTLTLAADVSSVVRVFVQSRVLLRYS